MYARSISCVRLEHRQDSCPISRKRRRKARKVFDYFRKTRTLVKVSLSTSTLSNSPSNYDDSKRYLQSNKHELHLISRLFPLPHLQPSSQRNSPASIDLYWKVHVNRTWHYHKIISKRDYNKKECHPKPVAWDCGKWKQKDELCAMKKTTRSSRASPIFLLSYFRSLFLAAHKFSGTT